MKYNCYIIEDEISKNSRGSKNLLLTLMLTLFICMVEFIGGFISRSNALIADAGHMLTDSASLFVCYFASLVARRKADSEKTYGYYRIEILASLINGTLLIILAIFVIYNALRRYFSPVDIDGGIMLVVSLSGLIANLVGILLLKGDTHNLNIKSALLHIIGDTLSSIGVIAGSLIIIYTGYYIVDAIVSTIIGFVIFINAVRLIRDATNILLEAVPSTLKVKDIMNDIKSSISEIKDIHDVHIWSISSGIFIFSIHIVTEVKTIEETDTIIKRISSLMREKYNILHTTVQVESANFERGR
ncbi:MAG: cation diffusion facilitator family transporter [Myxococcota bacterium]